MKWLNQFIGSGPTSPDPSVSRLIEKLKVAKEVPMTCRELLAAGPQVIEPLMAEMRAESLSFWEASAVIYLLESFGEPAIPALVSLLTEDIKPIFNWYTASCALQEMGYFAVKALSAFLGSRKCTDTARIRITETFDYMERCGRNISDQEKPGVCPVIDLVTPNKDGILARHRALLDAERIPEENGRFLDVHCEYFDFLFRSKVSLTTDVLIDVLHAQVTREGSKCVQRWTDIAEELIKRRVSSHAKLAEALTGGMRRIGYFDGGRGVETLKSMLKLLLHNSGGSDLAQMLIQIYEEVASSSSELSAPIRQEILELGAVSLDLLEKAVRSGAERTEDYQQMIREIRGMPPTEPEVEEPEAWEQFKDYVRIPNGIPDTECRQNMRFQFMFSGWAQADRIISSLPDPIRSTLGRPYNEMRGSEQLGSETKGKYIVWYEDITLTIRQAKDMMNHVVQAGGEIYEAFLE